MHGATLHRLSIFLSAAHIFGVPMTTRNHTAAPPPGATDHRQKQSVVASELKDSALAVEIERLTRLMPGEPTMSEEQVAALLKKDPKTIQNRRLCNPETVPPFVYMHGYKGVVYMRDDVIRFMAIQILNTRGRRVHRI